ncbi:MAG: MBL fold metallo-hydrolase [Bacteroidota bacterium]
MIQIKTFIFNDFGVNTYILTDETGDCIIIDPACNDRKEEKTLSNYIAQQQLKPVSFTNTHCHVDHIAGNYFIKQAYSINLITHTKSVYLMEAAGALAGAIGFNLDKVIMPDKFVNQDDSICFGNSELKVLYTPGHAEGSICLYSKKDNFVITGDVLFEGSIGRTDFPTGDYDTLIASIQNQLMVLPDDCKVYPGHGNPTTIGKEKRTNPFL